MSDTEWQIKGDAEAEEFASRFDLEIETEAATVGGWVMEHEERVPDRGDSFVFGAYRVTVLDADERHVLLVGLKKEAAEQETGEKES